MNLKKPIPLSPPFAKGEVRDEVLECLGNIAFIFQILLGESLMPRSSEEKIEWLIGQVSVLGMGLQAALKHRPNRAEVAATIHESFEKSYVKKQSTGCPEAFPDGMKVARDLFLLKKQGGPGQPHR